MLKFLRKVNPALEADKARRALNSRRPGEAAAICEAALKAHPGNAECLTLLARAYEQLERVPEAIEAYEAACGEAPTYPSLIAAAELYRRIGDWGRGEEKFHAAVELFPTSVPAWQGLAEARKRLGKLDLVVQCCDMVAGLQPDSVAAQLDLADACAEAGDVARAAEVCDAVLEADPHNVRALHGRAKCLAAQAAWEQAVDVYERLLALAASDEAAQRARIHYDFAMALRHLGRHDEALGHLHACEEVQPNFLPAYRAILEMCRGKDDLPGAIDAARRALSIEPSEPAIWLDLGRLHLAAGEPKPALEAFAKARRIKPGYTEAIAGTAEALSAAGHHERALEICQKLVVKRAFQPLPHLAYARVLRNAGQRRAALRQVGIALAIAPADGEAKALSDELS